MGLDRRPGCVAPYRASGAHFNDRDSVAIKDGALHIDNDGARGQFTRYYLRPADTPESTIDLTIEGRVFSNAGCAATVSIPYVGKFRLYPNRVQMVGHEEVQALVEPGSFHTYRFLRVPGKVTVSVDGVEVIETDKVDEWAASGTLRNSRYLLAVGNEATTNDAQVFPHQITTEFTGYSVWKSFHQIFTDPTTGRREIFWSAASGEFPDQYQLDHIVKCLS